ncbi:glycosyltransferase family 2 protein [uncultured Litoreibacter sp.]|uniref:glycosyltransferase family 2 protein n=1 Tax=uncultured Litoreibacter sp. TaxID=1392394 RepID=UPI002633AE7D|nr:glycosyltransferase family 2 protein [uncultured Litoreibacter sp.]
MSRLGVIIVTYNSADVIRDCLETLLSSAAKMAVVVVDNASTDSTVSTITDWASGKDGYTPPRDAPFPVWPVAKPVARISLLRSPSNGGFATGVNIGLKHLLKKPDIDRFWVLNPDTLVPPETPEKLADAPDGFALMGNRLLYADSPHHVQLDAGTINWTTGVTGNLNLGQTRNTAIADAGQAAFISGASMVASRAFVEAAGLMSEDYFLYYEEVDWALRRGGLPLAICPDATVYHRAGTAIGSPTLTTAASPFSTYYKHRARMKFLRRHKPLSLLGGYVYGLAKAGQMVRLGQTPQAVAVLRALHGLPISSNKAAQPRNEIVQRRI